MNKIKFKISVFALSFIAIMCICVSIFAVVYAYYENKVLNQNNSIQIGNVEITLDDNSSQSVYFNASNLAVNTGFAPTDYSSAVSALETDNGTSIADATVTLSREQASEIYYGLYLDDSQYDNNAQLGENVKITAFKLNGSDGTLTSWAYTSFSDAGESNPLEGTIGQGSVSYRLFITADSAAASGKTLEFDMVATGSTKPVSAEYVLQNGVATVVTVSDGYSIAYVMFDGDGEWSISQDETVLYTGTGATDGWEQIALSGMTVTDGRASLTLTSSGGSAYLKNISACAHSEEYVSKFVSASELSETEQSSATYGGIFYKACPICGKLIGYAVPSYPYDGYSDRTVTITTGGNEATYGAYTCYTNSSLNGGIVTFDALATDGLFIIDASKLSGATTIAYTNTAIKLLVNSDVTIDSLEYSGSVALQISGSGTLTVSGAYKVQNSEIDCNVEVASVSNYNNAASITVNGGKFMVSGTAEVSTLNVYGGTTDISGTLSVQNLTVGSAGSETSPVFVARNGINNQVWGHPAAIYSFVNGTSYVYVGSGEAAIYLNNSGSTVTVDGGTLNVLSSVFGIKGGSIALNFGALNLQYTDSNSEGYGAFTEIAGLTVAEGQTVNIKNYKYVVYNASSCTYSISGSIHFGTNPSRTAQESDDMSTNVEIVDRETITDITVPELS